MRRQNRTNFDAMHGQDKGKDRPEPTAKERIEQRKLLTENRCGSCGQLLMNAKIEVGQAEVKCHRCGHMNWIQGNALSTK